MRILLIFVLISVTCSCYAQTTRGANVILFINEQIVIGSIANVRLIVQEGRELEVSYYPGRFIINMDELALNQMILKNDSLTLAFDYYEKGRNKQLLYNYRLPFNPGWLKLDYFIMMIYDLDKKKYRKKFNPLDAKRNYTFELIHSGGEMRRIKRG